MANTEKQTSSQKVEALLREAYQSVQSKQRLSLLLRSALIVLAGCTAFIITEHVLYLSVSAKSVILGVLISAAAFSLWKGLSSSNPTSFREFYRKFSRESNLPELKDTLDLEKSSSGNRALVDAAILQNLGKIETQRLQDTLTTYTKSSDSYKSYSRLFTLTIATLAVLGITAFNFNSATQRSFTFWESYSKPNPFLYTVTPGDVTVEQGSPFQVEVQFTGDLIPRDVSLRIKTSVEEEFRTRAMEASGTYFRSIPQDLNNEMQYYVEMDGYRSKLFTADVQLRPRFSELQATVIPPEYTELDSSIISYPISQLRAYEGSTVKLSGSLNKMASYLQMYTSTELLDLFVEQDSTFSYEIEVSRPDTLRFYIEDESGLTNQNPFQIIVVPQADEYPLVELLEPEESIQQVNPTELELLYRATDDFGLTSASLNYELRRAYVEEPVTGSLPLNKPQEGALQPYVWDLQPFELKPQDELTFWISATDNDRYNGFKSSNSQKLKLTVPSMVDYFEDVDKKEDDVESELEDISKSFEETRRQYQEFKERMKDNPENTGYEEKRELEQVQKQQEEVQKKIDELNKKFEELKEEMSRDNMLSEETQKAYDELQKLMKEIDDPAFREAMEKLQEQLGQMNPEQLRQAMENLEFNEELYRERLERTVELFKQLKLNSDLDKLAKSFEDMARKEEERAQKEETDPDESAQNREQQLEQSLKENEKLKNQVDSLSNNTSAKNEKAVSEFQEETRKELEQLSDDLKEEIESGEQGNQGEQNENQNSQSQQNQSQNQQNNRQQKYEQLAKNTRSMMQNMGQQQKNINIAGLQYVLYSLLNLSLEQEDLTTLASATENRSQAYVNYARNQRNVEGIFKSVSDSLFQLSAEIPQFSNQINRKKLEVEKRLQRSLEQMLERNRSQSSVASRQALGGINDISFMIANLLEQLQNSQSGGGGGGMSMQQMMEQLQQSGQMQQQLNQQLQDIINDMQGERLNQNQMERLNQIAKQQNRIRKQLQELQQQGEMDGDRIGSELERMIEDMEDTINELRGGSADPTMVERQQNILSRMLQAEQAMQERGEEEKREGKLAQEFEQSRPPEMTLEELQKEIRNRLNDPNFTKYSPDYQRLIENYFELLKSLQEQQESIN
ncbi:DUF4175 family protein [Gracilimonas sediminicola]|uniref:DUF4175 family protein n=1 Tax=Gracilimonas sediminicola TaxID=2952158 RepID=UPI0038D3CF1F